MSSLTFTLFTLRDDTKATPKKQRLIKTARIYLAKKNIRAFCRFDVAVVHHDGGNVVFFKYYKSAFDASSK